MNALHRIVDANANRAREALRVMEDVARFGLDDAALMRDIKQLRHGLRLALDQDALERGLLLAGRDSDHDTGRSVKAPAELERRGLHDLAAAAGSRLTEALRSIEEACKALGGDPAPIESIRYAAYAVERRLLLGLPPARCPQWKLCVLVTESLCGGRTWLDVARAALEGGADCLQLREKDLTDRELLSRARALVELGGEFKRAVIINDRPDIALQSGAAGVHLGQEDLPVGEVRRLVGFRLLIGVSTTDLDQARAAAQAGADYCGVGPMFPTTTKHKPTIAGSRYLRAYLADPVLSQRPHLAIGGVSAGNVHELVLAGCKGIAVSAAVCAADDPSRACRDLVQALESAPVHSATPR